MPAQGQGQERTEAATPRRLEEAHKRGQYARSAELPGAAALLLGALVLRATGPALWQRLADLLQTQLAVITRPDLTPGDVAHLFGQMTLAGALAVAPILGALGAMGIAASLMQTGFLLAGQALTPRFDRINPFQGMQRLFSANTGFELTKMILRLAVLGASIVSVLSGFSAQLTALASVGILGAPAIIGDLAQTLILRVALASAGLAALDYGYQRWRFARDLRMTRQEVRDEQRQNEGDPMIKMRIRRLQRERARKRMMQDVPKATMVLANPTHFAVALRYESGKMRAPVVVAKGADYMAEQIKEVARQHNVPIFEQPALARALYAAVPLDREIPVSFYRAVAEVLAVIYQLKRRW